MSSKTKIYKVFTSNAGGMTAAAVSKTLKIPKRTVLRVIAQNRSEFFVAAYARPLAPVYVLRISGNEVDCPRPAPYTSTERVRKFRAKENQK